MPSWIWPVLHALSYIQRQYTAQPCTRTLKKRERCFNALVFQAELKAEEAPEDEDRGPRYNGMGGRGRCGNGMWEGLLSCDRKRELRISLGDPPKHENHLTQASGPPACSSTS